MNKSDISSIIKHLSKDKTIFFQTKYLNIIYQKELFNNWRTFNQTNTMNIRQKQLSKVKNHIPKHQLELHLQVRLENKRITRNHTSKIQFRADRQNSKISSKVLNQKRTSRPQKGITKRKSESSVNKKIMATTTYQSLHCQYLRMKNEQISEMIKQKQQVSKLTEGVRDEKKKLLKVLMLRDKLAQDLNRMSQQYNQLRMSNYHIRCRLYADDGQIESHYYQSQPELGYEEMLRLQQQIGMVDIGYPPAKLALLPAQAYNGLQQRDCCICCCGVEKGQSIAKTKCQHMLHHQCLVRWLQFKKTCPLCRQQIIIP